jgi:thioesterase domain-containing protein
MNVFHRRLASLSPAKRELFALLDPRAGVPGPAAEPYDPEHSSAPAPLAALVPIRPTGSRPPIFCVHSASGSAYVYGGFARVLPPDQPLYAFEAPGLDGSDQAPVESIEELAIRYALVLRDTGPGPYALLGWSMGGLVAFETARRLLHAGEAVQRLIVIDAPPPVGHRRLPESEISKYFLAELLGQRVQPSDGPTSEEEPDMDDLLAQVRAVGGPLGDLDVDQLRRRYQVFRANLRGTGKYRSAWRFPGRLMVIRASESVSLRSAWAGFAAEIDEHEVPGNHYSIWESDRLPALCRLIQGFA